MARTAIEEAEDGTDHLIARAMNLRCELDEAGRASPTIWRNGSSTASRSPGCTARSSTSGTGSC